MTLDEVYAFWMPVKKRLVKESTIAAYKLIYHSHLKPRFGNTNVNEIKRKDVLNFVYGKLDCGLSKKTVHDIVIALGVILRFASEEMEVDGVQCSWKITWPTQSASGGREICRLSKAECRKLTDYILANPSPSNLGLLVTLYTGMRIGEICALQWKDIDLRARTIGINKTAYRLYDVENHSCPTKLVIGPPKSVSSRREIPISPVIYKILKDFSKVVKPDYYVVTCSPRLPEPRCYREHFNHLQDKLGIGRINFHGLRHTFASTLIDNKADVKTVSMLLGHSNISTTLSIYVHPSEETKRNAISKLLKF